MFSSRKKKERKANQALDDYRKNDQAYVAATWPNGIDSPAAAHFGDQAKKALQEEQRLRESLKRHK